MSSQPETRWVAVDDGDPSITYNGDWYISDEQFDGALNAFGPVYLGSQHATKTAGGLSFTFQGSQVRLYGTSHQIANTSTLKDPEWDCSVDGITYGHESGYEDRPINQWTLCSVDLKSSAEHLLILGAAVRDATFYFDSILYRPSYELRNSLHPTVYLHHSDAAIKFSDGGWVSHQGREAKLTREIGAKIKVAFNGTKATYFGRIPVGYPLANSTATYSIDEGDPVEFDVMGLPRDIDNALYYFPLFETPSFSQGEHTLEVVHKGPGAPLVFEYFLVENGDIVQPEGLVLDFNDAKGSYPSNPSGGRGPKKTPVSAIVGGTVGGVVVISITGILLFLYLKRKKGNSQNTDLLPRIVHSPVEPSGHILLPPHSNPPLTTQVHSSTNLLVSPVSGTPTYSSSHRSDTSMPSPPIMSVTPAASIPAYHSPHYAPPSITYTPPAQNAPPTPHLPSLSSQPGTSNDPPQYEESASSSAYPVNVKRPVSGGGKSPVFFTAPQDGPTPPYDLSLLGLSSGPSSSYRTPTKGQPT